MRYIAARPVYGFVHGGMRTGVDNRFGLVRAYAGCGVSEISRSGIAAAAAALRTAVCNAHSADPIAADDRSGATAGNRFISVPLSGAAANDGPLYVSSGKIVAITLAPVKISFHWKYLSARRRR
jgi:hypothetical protein